MLSLGGLSCESGSTIAVCAPAYPVKPGSPCLLSHPLNKNISLGFISWT